MTETVSLVAQDAQDAFYQDFRGNDGFFRLEDFERYVIAADAKLKRDEFDAMIALNLRSRKPNAPVVLSADNYDTVSVSVKDDQVVLPNGIMFFPGSAGEGLSVQITPEGGCGNIMPLTQKTKWQAARDKDTVYWIPTKCGIEFLNLKGNCTIKNVTVTYIPELTADSSIQLSRKWAIINMITIFLKSAKDGVVIDKSDDSNPNSTVQTEINKNVLRALQMR